MFVIDRWCKPGHFQGASAQTHCIVMEDVKGMQCLYLSLLMGDKDCADAMLSDASRLQTLHPKTLLFIAGVFNHLLFLLSAVFRSVCHLRHPHQVFLQLQTMDSF